MSRLSVIRAAAVFAASMSLLATADDVGVPDSADQRPGDPHPGDPLPGDEDPRISAQRLLEALEYEPAASTALAAIDDIERFDRYDTALLPLYQIVGDAAMAMGDHERALGAYGQALFILRLEQGLNAPGQLDVVYRQAEALIANGEIARATERFEYAYQVVHRLYGKGDARTQPALVKLARWYEDVRFPQVARMLYEQALEMDGLDDSSVSQGYLEHLLRVGRTHRLQAFPSSKYINGRPLFEPRPFGFVLAEGTVLRETRADKFGAGQNALSQAVELAESLHGEDSVEVARAVLELGDWWLLFKQWRRAFDSYDRVWAILAVRDPQRLQEVFGQPTPLYDIRPGNPKRMLENMRAERLRPGGVEYAFTITDRGRVTDVQTIRSTPEDFDGFGYRKALATTRYRPAFSESKPVTTYDHRRIIEFDY